MEAAKKKRFWMNVMLLILSIFIINLIFPPFDYYFLIPVAFVPLIMVAASEFDKKMFFLAWLAGTIYYMIALYWVSYIAFLGLLALSLYLGLYIPIFMLIVHYAYRKKPSTILWIAPFVWVGLEYIRSILISGFPWILAGHSLYKNILLIQIADITGVYGISFIIIWVNVLIAVVLMKLIKLNRFEQMSWKPVMTTVAAICIIILFQITYGIIRVNQVSQKAGPKLMLVQANIPQTLENPFTNNPNYATDVYFKHEFYTYKAMQIKPDLVVWPEGMLPWIFPSEYYEDAKSSKMFYQILTEQGEEYEKFPIVIDRLKQLAQVTKANLLIGCTYAEQPNNGADKRIFYNAALLFSKTGAVLDKYLKVHLVPFGEFIPLRDVFPFLNDVVRHYTELTPNLYAGKEHTVFSLNGYTFGVLICYEDIFPYLARTYKRKKVDFLITITNDAWFKRSAELDQHLSNSVFRCVETRLPMARAANSGISSFIDGNGKIYTYLKNNEGKDKEVEGIITSTVALDNRASLYAYVGDVFAILCLVVVGGFLGKYTIRRILLHRKK